MAHGLGFSSPTFSVLASFEGNFLLEVSLQPAAWAPSEETAPRGGGRLLDTGGLLSVFSDLELRAADLQGLGRRSLLSGDLSPAPEVAELLYPRSLGED